MSDLRLSQIRRVTLHYKEGSPFQANPTYLIPASEVPRFVEASKRLHFKPGKNPHNGNETPKIWKITSAVLELKGPFWWTTPSLRGNHDPKGAHTIDSYREHTEWLDRETYEKWQAEDEREEYESEMDALSDSERSVVCSEQTKENTAP